MWIDSLHRRFVALPTLSVICAFPCYCVVNR
uniref:Uncharacterized protein n=1 Tax=Arundo donax TaxID=35708 RepID=A0A0A9C2Z7_ARUDO